MVLAREDRALQRVNAPFRGEGFLNAPQPATAVQLIPSQEGPSRKCFAGTRGRREQGLQDNRPEHALEITVSLGDVGRGGD